MAGDGTYHVELESSQNYFTYLPYIEGAYTVQWNRYGMAGDGTYHIELESSQN